MGLGLGLESSGLTALPRPEFCMYTSGTWLGLGLGLGLGFGFGFGFGFALHLVLRLVRDVGRAAPADEEDHRARVHLGVRRGEQRVDRVAEARVLHVHERHLARGHVVAQRHAHRGALVGGDDMAHARARAVELGAEGGDAAVGHAWARGRTGVRG